ncbi:hypothetical Protein YC6258_02751 [Gynuella sunshinyii YC6258]|uniref:Uncharacterized protein n=1 Tax=Gynuella sunshinyii YC6258 TaxID=1445510 RepID=A0A0C5VWJ7_9GAMM|nr:hypothetical Protein YC6258_02751 [Gynuella sunshinyii YC6258]
MGWVLSFGPLFERCWGGDTVHCCGSMNVKMRIIPIVATREVGYSTYLYLTIY